MQPGVKTAPGFFQDLMGKMLSGAKGAFVFIDDIIVGGVTEKEHKDHVFEVLERVQNFGFKLRIEKCNFGQQQIKYCGHIINAEGVKMDPEKIVTIQAIPRPCNVAQLRWKVRQMYQRH